MYQFFRFLFKEELAYTHVHLLYEFFLCTIDELSYRKLPPDNYEITQLHTVKVYSIVDYCKGLRYIYICYLYLSVITNNN